MESLPRDLPLPASPPNSATWLREANILQPYALSQFVALANPGDRPARLKQDFGFNAIIVLPTDAHNVSPDLKDRVAHSLTDEQFRAGVAAYRAAGYRLILYTSVMALGLSPDFMSEKIKREHPDWLQRDPKGNPVMVWGVPWLCPNTGARDAALTRAVRIAKEYRADGIMLDNNQFFFAEGGWTCHCDSCKKAFREYVGCRFGVKKTKRLFGVAPDKLPIPTEAGPLFSLWMHWRNRVWAEVNESFRARLRQVNPKIMFFANTQFLFETGMLGTDFQYEREDVLLSETVGLNSRQISEKMVRGHALAAGRPLWNYIGTFSKPDDYTALLPATTISPMIAATLAHAARPWIVDGFDLGPTDATARKEMSRLLGWHATHQEFFTGESWAGVATLISPNSRNVLKRPLIPPHLSALQNAGTPVIGLRDAKLSAKELRPFRFLTVETAASLNDESARVLAKWVRKGGTLIAAADTGTYDELGRKRTDSSLWRALDLKNAPKKIISIGRGKVVAPESGEFATTALQLTQPASFQIAPDAGIEIVAYQKEKSLLLHLVRHQPADKPVTLRLPEIFRAADMRAQFLIPGAGAQTLSLSTEAGVTAIGLTNIPAYGVIKIPLR
ncbi:MAG: alpha-amylase family protein [Verrucomicrobiota bacterium]